MRITQDKGSGDSVPFVELSIEDYDGYGGTSEITIRKYPRRIFVAYSQDNGLYQGDDNMDVFIAPSYITEKTLHAEFDLLSALNRVCKKIYPNSETMGDYLFSLCSRAWDFIMQGNLTEAHKNLPEEGSDD